MEILSKKPKGERSLRERLAKRPEHIGAKRVIEEASVSGRSMGIQNEKKLASKRYTLTIAAMVTPSSEELIT